MNTADIKKIVDARDKTMTEAQVEFNKTVATLQAEFVDAQKKLAESFQQRENDALKKANDTVNDAVNQYDKALDELAKATMAASLKDVPAAPTPVTTRASTVVATAEQVAKKYKASDLKDLAKTYGLSTSGGEIQVTQRLLDAGWVPDPSVMK